MRFRVPPFAIVQGEAMPPSKPQRRFARAAASVLHTYLVGGLRSGKSFIGAWVFLCEILKNREALQQREAARGRRRQLKLRYVAAAPTHQQCEVGAWTHLMDILGRWEGGGLIKGKPHISQGQRRIDLITGDSIYFVAMDAGNYKGATISGVWCDEIDESQNPMAAWNLLADRLSDPNAPRLFMLATSTVRHTANNVWAMFKERIAAGDPTYAMLHTNTASNPAVARTGYVERRAATMSEDERLALLEGKPQPPSNTIFGKEFSPTDSISKNWQWRGKRSDREYHVSVDWGASYAAVLIEHDPVRGEDVVFGEYLVDGCQDEDFLAGIGRELLAPFGLTWDDIADKGALWGDWNPKSAWQVAAKLLRGVPTRKQRIDTPAEKEDGISTVRWRLRASDGKRRLFLAPRLAREAHKRGAYTSLQNQVRQEVVADGLKVQTMRVNQESPYSHINDAIRAYCWVRYGPDRLHGAPILYRY